VYPHIGHARDLLYYRPEKGGEERYISEFVEQSMLDSGRPQLVVLRAVVITKVDRNVDRIVLPLHFPLDSSLLSSNTLLYSGRITHLAPIFQRRVQNLTRDDIIYLKTTTNATKTPLRTSLVKTCDKIPGAYTTLEITLFLNVIVVLWYQVKRVSPGHLGHSWIHSTFRVEARWGICGESKQYAIYPAMQ